MRVTNRGGAGPPTDQGSTHTYIYTFIRAAQRRSSPGTFIRLPHHPPYDGVYPCVICQFCSCPSRTHEHRLVYLPYCVTRSRRLYVGRRGQGENNIMLYIKHTHAHTHTIAYVYHTHIMCM